MNLNIAVGKKESFAILKKSGYMSEIMNNKSMIVGKKNFLYLNITVKTLKNICKAYIHKKQDIHFCKIDIEGGERDALLGYDFENYRPKVFCIEATKPGTAIQSHKLWENILLKNDYSFAYQYIINRFYVDNRIPYLKERFNLVEKSIKYYKININRK